MSVLALPPCDRAALIARYDGRAPRYTSYPTAVQFTPAVGEADYRRWLAALPEADPVSLYLHIPFCARLCWYCGCKTRAVNRHAPVGAYAGLLGDEIGLLAPALPGRLPLRAVHFGGGTPNMLAPEELDFLFGRIRSVFDALPGIEIAAELDPAVLGEDWVRAATRLGLNRASLGVQNLDPAVQAAVNRRETVEEVAQAVRWLRAAGVRSVNLDLMYGLPHQTVANTLATLESVLRLRPERLALFGYAHVPWMKPHQRLIDEAALPDAAARLEQSEAAAERLVAEGYVRIGIDHFALPEDGLAAALRGNRLRRNFQGYTDEAASALLGVGVSSIGSLPQGHVQNAADELAWRRAVGEGRLPVVRGVALNDEDRFRGEVIERLMCDFAVDLDAVAARHGRPADALAAEAARLAPFIHDGLVRRQGSRIAVTEAGRLLVRSVAAAFDAYFAPQAERHSRAL